VNNVFSSPLAVGGAVMAGAALPAPMETAVAAIAVPAEASSALQFTV
jgi:hypothetical protein